MKPDWIASSRSAFVMAVVCGGLMQACGSNTVLDTHDGTGGVPGKGGAAVLNASGGAGGNGGVVGQGGSGGREADAALNLDAPKGGDGGAITTIGAGGVVAADGAIEQTGGRPALGGVAGTASAGGRIGTGGAGQGGATGTGATASTGGTIGTGTGAPAGTVCGGRTGVTCPSGEYCDLASRCGRISDATGICERTGGVICTAVVRPVCGCDGKTYSNDCVRNGAGVLKASDGACPSVDGGATARLERAPGGVGSVGAALIARKCPTQARHASTL